MSSSANFDYSTCSLRNNSTEFSIQFICCNYIWLHSSVQFHWAFLHEHLALPATLVTLAATFYQFQAGCRGEWQCASHWHPRQILLIQCQTVLFS